MGKISDWIKANAKEGADISAVEALIEASTIEGIDSKEKAYDFMTKNPFFTSALDMATTKAVNSHDEKFKSDKLPELVKAEREKLMKELNPGETEDQKKLRELEEWKTNQLLKDARYEQEKLLRAKAKELSYPEEMAERYTAFGEKALEFLESDAKFWKSDFETKMEAKVKELYKGNPPKQSTSDPAKQITRQQFETLTPEDKSAHFKSGGTIVD